MIAQTTSAAMATGLSFRSGPSIRRLYGSVTTSGRTRAGVDFTRYVCWLVGIGPTHHRAARRRHATNPRTRPRSR